MIDINKPTVTDFTGWIIGDTRSDIGSFLHDWNIGSNKPVSINFKYNLYGIIPRNDIGAFDSSGFYNMPNDSIFNYWLFGEERNDIGGFSIVSAEPVPPFNVMFDNITVKIEEDGTRHYLYKDIRSLKNRFVEYIPPNLR